MKSNEIRVTTADEECVSFPTQIQSVKLPHTCETHISARFKRNAIVYGLLILTAIAGVAHYSRYQVIEITDHQIISREAGDQLHYLGIYWEHQSRSWQVPSTAVTKNYISKPYKKRSEK